MAEAGNADFLNYCKNSALPSPPSSAGFGRQAEGRFGAANYGPAGENRAASAFGKGPGGAQRATSCHRSLQAAALVCLVRGAGRTKLNTEALALPVTRRTA